MILGDRLRGAPKYSYFNYYLYSTKMARFYITQLSRGCSSIHICNVIKLGANKELQKLLLRCIKWANNAGYTTVYYTVAIEDTEIYKDFLAVGFIPLGGKYANKRTGVILQLLELTISEERK